MRNEGRGQEDTLSRELAGGGAATSRGHWRKERMKNPVKRQRWLLPQAPLLGGRKELLELKLEGPPSGSQRTLRLADSSDIHRAGTGLPSKSTLGFSAGRTLGI